MTLLRSTTIWKEKKNTWDEIHVSTGCLIFVFNISSSYSLTLKLGHFPEKHLGSSPFICSYLFAES